MTIDKTFTLTSTSLKTLTSSMIDNLGATYDDMVTSNVPFQNSGNAYSATYSFGSATATKNGSTLNIAFTTSSPTTHNSFSVAGKGALGNNGVKFGELNEILISDATVNLDVEIDGKIGFKSDGLSFAMPAYYSSHMLIEDTTTGKSFDLYGKFGSSGSTTTGTINALIYFDGTNYFVKEDLSFNFATDSSTIETLISGALQLSSSASIIHGDEGKLTNETLTGTGSAEYLFGGLGNDKVLADGGDDQLYGGTGNDNLNGDEGDDTLEGGTGNDKLSGGNGDDTYTLDANTNGKGDVVFEKANEGNDTVNSSISYTLVKEVENLNLTGSGNIGATGNKGDNMLTGNAGDNTLYGKEGNDELSGGSGGDKFVFDTKLNESSNIDTIIDFVSGTDDISLSKKIFKGYSAGADLTDDFVYGAGATAQDATDHFIYDTSTGALYYDTDGSGDKAAVQFAILGESTHPTLAASDLLIIA